MDRHADQNAASSVRQSVHKDVSICTFIFEAEEGGGGLMGSLLKLAGSEMKFGLCHEAGRSIEAKMGCLSTGITI
jgi:hypothetical protein